MTDAELSKVIWDLANAMTAFSAAQAVVFTYACAKKETGDLLNKRRLKLAIAISIALICTVQGFVVYWCMGTLCALDANHCPLHREATVGRMLCIATAGSLSILILYARQLFSKHAFDS